jgi:GTP cyclohydrolase I
MTPEDHLRAALSAVACGIPEGMVDTPARVVKAWRDMTRGYGEDPASILSRTFDADGYDQIVCLRGVAYQSLCEHHLLPFTGTVDLAYLPGARVVGLSKLARLVDCFARRFQIQERMTKQIADAMETHLAARGVAVVVRGAHSCMTARGVLKPGAEMMTSEMRGSFRDHAEARAEVAALLRERRG